MRRHIIFMLLTTFLLSCSEREDFYRPVDNPEIVAEQGDSFQKEFAKTLSKAVYRNSDLRKFIKDEALKQFDNDYDVFYPLLKNEMVSGDSTFRDIMLAYADDKELFTQMESEMPMVNILVPDWSWITGFNADSWDVSDPEVAVSYAEDNDNHIIFGDGEEIGSFEKGEFPGLPVLMVKNNERLIKGSGNSDSKSFLGEYEFIDEAFDGLYQPQKRVASQYYDIDIQTEEANNFVPASELDPLLIEAYNVYKDSLSSEHRDYVYYSGNMNMQSHRKINNNVIEKLYKIRISPDAYRTLSDQQYEDPHLTNVSHKKNALSTEEILNRIWTEGKYEMIFKFVFGKGSDAIDAKEVKISINPKDLFDVSTIHVEYKHGTWFSKAHYIYRVGASDLKSKWYVCNYPITNWDISSLSTNAIVYVYEYDPKGTVVSTQSIQNVFSYTIKDDDYETTNSTTITTTYQMTIPGESEELGHSDFRYSNRIVMSESTFKGINGYNINPIYIGYIDLMILPVQTK